MGKQTSSTYIIFSFSVVSARRPVTIDFHGEQSKSSRDNVMDSATLFQFPLAATFHFLAAFAVRG